MKGETYGHEWKCKSIDMSPKTHPLTALSEGEIRQAAGLIRGGHEHGTKIQFKGVSLYEPSKKDFQRYREQKGKYLPARKAWVNYYLVGTSRFFEVVVDLTKNNIERKTEVPRCYHGPVDDEEILAVEKITLKDPRVKAEIEKLNLPPGATVVCDPWIW